MNTDTVTDAGFAVSGRNYGLVPMQGQAADEETQLARLTDFMNAGYDAEAAKRAREYYGEGVPIEHISEEDKSYFVGAAFARIKQVPNNPEAYWVSQKKEIPDVEREQMYELMGGELRQQSRVAWDERQQKLQELQRELDEVQSGLADALPRYALGEDLSPELMERVSKFGKPEEVFPSLKRARAAVELVRGWNYGGRSKADFEDAVQARFERLRVEDLQPVTSGGNLVSETRLQRMHSDEELMQQARSDEGDSYMVSREQMAALADVLSGEDGQLDKGALGAFLLAIDADAQGQQTVDSRFIRNTVEAMKGSLLDAADFVNRGNAAAGVIWQGPDMPAVYLDDAGRADFARAYDERVSALRGHLAQLEGRRLDAAEKAELHSWLLTKGGTIVGENVPYLVTGAVGNAARLGYVGTSVLGGIANAPALMNRSIDQAYAEGKKNAGFVGSVKGLAQSWAEAAFVPMPGGTAIVNRTLDALARKTISLPGAGKMIGAVWGNGLLRYVATTAGASAGELLGEEVLAQSVQYPVLSFARAVGMDLDAPEWQPFADSWKMFNDDPRQAAATVVYCALIGASGARGNAYAAREFAKEYRNLMAAGLKAGSARRLSLQAEQAASAKDIEKLCTDMRETYRREVQEGDPVALQKRLEKEGASFLDEVEMQMYARSGVRDYVLKRAGILAGDKTAAGLNRVTLPNKENPDKATVLEWTDEQLNAWVEMQHEGKVVETMRELQARIAGAALGDAAVDDADIKGMLVNLRDLPVRALARMQRTGGRVTYAVLKDLAADAREQVAGFVEGGMSERDAYQQMSEIPGVRLGALVNAAEGFTQRVEAIVGTPEGDALGIRSPEDASTSVFRLNGVAPGQSVLLFNKGLATEREMVEDLIERDVVAATSGEHAVTSLAALEKVLRRVQSHLVRYEGGMRLLPKDKEASEMDIVEAFSKLAQSRFLLNHEQYSMPQEAHDTIEYVQKKLAHTQHLVALSRAWDAFARSEEGRAFIEKEGATLEKLMSDAGASVAGQYSRAKFDAEAFEAVRLAYEQSVASPEAARTLLDEYEAEQQELDHPQEEETNIPASASITGETLPLFDSAPVDQETGEQQLQPGEVELSCGNLGRGLVGERYVEVGDGSVLGVAEVENITLSTDVPQFKKKESAVGRVEADADGTTHELAGGWNANAAPIHVWRRTDGRLEVISGRHRLAHALRNGVKFIQVRVYDESAERDAQWAKLHDVEQNILDNTCNAIDVAYYFRHNPLTMAEAEARGLMPKTRAGEQTAASRIGLTVAANASDNTFELLVNGRCTAEDAYMTCLIASTEEGQQLALDARAGKNGKKNSWEYVTALVRGAEQMQPADGGMLDLFGNDDAFRESSEKLARYVAAVREGLKARLNVLMSAGRLNKKGDVSKELGVKVKTPKDATRLIERLANLDAAYERLDPDLGIPAKADAWDGKSAVPTKLDELAGESSYSLSGVVSPEMDARYMAALKRGDMDAAQRMVNDVARMRGYMPDSDYQGSECFNGAAPSANAYFDTADERYEAWENGEFEGTISLADFVRRGMDPGELEWLVTSPSAYQRADQYKRETIDAIRKAKSDKRGMVTIYRAVPADVEEGSIRNGDWVTFSKAYAEYHITLQDWEKGRVIEQKISIDDVWWDNNDVNEWGYDDGKEYAYRNTANNRKLLDAVTYDKNGDIVPLSKRFDYSSPDVSFSVIGQRAKTLSKYKDKAFAGRDDGMLRAEIDASQAKLRWGVLRGKNVAAYRQIIADWGKLPKDERQIIESFAELCAERDEASMKLNETDENDFQEAYAAAKKLVDEAKAKRVKVREILGEFFKMKGADGSVAITAKDEIIDAMAVDFWCEWASDKVEDVLKSDPMAFGMALLDVLDYPELYEAYPQLEELPVYTEDLKGYNGLAGNNGWGDYIMMNRSLLDNWEKFHSTLLHEVQHVIQRIEGFAKGGNKESVQRKVKELLKGTESRIEWLERDLRWFSAVDIARDFLKEARTLRKYPNAWRRSGQRFRFARMSSSSEEVREAILRDIAERYKKFRQEDTSETLLLDMTDSLLPEVYFSSLESIEVGLDALSKMKSRKLAFRGTAAKKNRRLVDLQKRYNGIKRVLDEFEYEPYELYVRLAGEIEARNVQERLYWTAEERVARPFNDTLEYPGEALVTFSVQSVTANWSATLDRFVKMPPMAGTVPYRKDLPVCPTPAVMQMVGAKGWDIVLSPSVLVKCLHKDTVLGNKKKLMDYYKGQKHEHDILLNDMKQLPAALADPVCIIVSATPGCIEVITELKEGANNILVAVQLDSVAYGTRTQRVNRIVSLYGKNGLTELLNRRRLYWNAAKARVWTGGGRLQLPTSPYPKRASGHRVLKPADLVKYKIEKGLSFSLSGRSMIDSVDIGVMAREGQMQRLVSHARREAARWERTFANGTTNVKAAEAMGTISSIQGAIYKVLPPKYRPALARQMRYVEVYARMLETGRVRAYGKLQPDELAALNEELGELLEVDLALVAGGIWYDENASMAEAEKEARKILTRELGAEKLVQAAARMLNDAADAVERWMIDVELERVERMKERLAPRKLPNGKYDKGKMSAEGYKEFVRFCGLMELDADAVAEKLHDLEALLAAEEGKDAPDAAKVDKLAGEMTELVAYGNMKEKSLEAVRKGVAALTAFVQNERNVWQGKLERERERTKRAARDMSELMGPGDEVKLAALAEKDEETLRMFGSMGAGFKSLAQMFYGMGGIPGLRTLMDESLEALAHGHVQLGLREQRAYDQLGEFLEKQLGLDTEAKRNDWMARLKKKIDTGVKRAGELVTHKLELTQEEAEGWLELGKAEREEKRQKMQEEADKAGVDAENVVYEEDIPLLRDELAKFDDLPGKRKYIRTERSWRKAQAGNIVASRDEILNILLLCEQAEYQQAADENGYTAEVLAKLREVVGEDVMAFGHEMRKVLEGSGLAAVYEAREGIPFPAVQNYWPGKFDLSAKMNEQANALDPTTGTGTRYGMLVTRVKHKLKFNLSLGASNVFLAALAQQNNYICMGELTARWRRLLSHSNFAMSLKQRLGDKQFRQLKELLNLLDGAGIAESVTQQNLSGLVARFQSAHAMAVLAGSPITLIKQTSAMLHAGAWEGINPMRVAWHLLKDRAGNGAISYGEVAQMDCFKVRHRDDRHFTEMLQLGRNANWSKLATWARTGMGWIEKMDVICNVASMTALYNIKYEQMQEANEGAADPLSEEEIRSICRKSVEQALELAAQPLRRTQKSAMAALSRNALVKSACYMSSESLNKIGMYAAIKQRNGGGIKGRVAALKFLLPMSIAQQATVMVLDMLRGSAPDTDDDDWAEWFWLNVATGCTGLGMLQSVPMLGEGVAWATGGYVKTASLGEMLFDFRGAARSGRRLWKMGTDGKDYSGWEWAWQMVNAGRIVTAGTAAGRGINSTSKVFSEVSGGLQSLNAVVNHVRPLIQRMRNREED